MAAFQSAFLFPPNRWHNHAPSIVECPNGDLLVCWFSGSGEREADDVQILGARKRAHHSKWSQPFLMADTPNYPDCNPCLFIDPRQRLWLVWITILNHRWEGSLLKYRLTRAYQRQLAPRWQEGEVFHISPDAKFVAKVEAYVQRQRERVTQVPPEHRPRFEAYLERILQYAHDELSRRLGWMTRQPPLILGNRLWLPLYSDGFDCSLIAISDDGGDTWRLSEPILAPGAIQPTLLKRKDGTLVAYMRDNGPPAQSHLDGGFPRRGLHMERACEDHDSEPRQQRCGARPAHRRVGSGLQRHGTGTPPARRSGLHRRGSELAHCPLSGKRGLRARGALPIRP
ncbi:MAG: hypothetical protein KatS3mg021_0541 [Fimbriimonadales bacterium]|nr:MAG: hypothetical protein KatS3mg021_0541 [Fimbriimonadales bacterium]